MPSTDVDLAAALLSRLQQQAPDHRANRLAAGISMVQDAYRQLDFLGGTAPISGLVPDLAAPLGPVLVAIEAASLDHGFQSQNADYEFFNDNRYQQHYWVWPD